MDTKLSSNINTRDLSSLYIQEVSSSAYSLHISSKRIINNRLSQEIVWSRTRKMQYLYCILSPYLLFHTKKRTKFKWIRCKGQVEQEQLTSYTQGILNRTSVKTLFYTFRKQQKVQETELFIEEPKFMSALVFSWERLLIF